MVPMRETYRDCKMEDGTIDLTMVLDAVIDCLQENGDVTYVIFPVGTPHILAMAMLQWIQDTTGLFVSSLRPDSWQTDYVAAGDDFWYAYEQFE